MGNLSNGKFLICFLVCLLTLFIVTWAHQGHNIPTNNVFPTNGQRRAVNRLLGPLGSLSYQFSHQVKRTLSKSDVSSILFQDHTELQIPFRTQYILSHQRREEMVNRLFNRHDGSIIIPFILPSLLDTMINDKPTFSQKELLVLNLLQQLQLSLPLLSSLNQQNEENKQQTSFQKIQSKFPSLFPQESDNNNQNDSILSSLGSILNGFDPLGDYESEALSPEQQSILLTDYRSHLLNLLKPQHKNDYSFYSLDLGKTTPLYTKGGLQSLHLEKDYLPILLSKIPSSSSSLSLHENDIINRFIQNNIDIFKSINDINTIIDEMINYKQILAIQKSLNLLSNALIDTGSTAYITTSEHYNFWLQLLTNRRSIYGNNNDNDDDNDDDVEYVISVQELFTKQAENQQFIIENNQQNNQQNKQKLKQPKLIGLAYHPYYLWESYELPITQPTSKDLQLFYQNQEIKLKTSSSSSPLLSSGSIPIPHAFGIGDSTSSNSNRSTIKGDDQEGAIAKFYENFLNIEFTFTSPIDEINILSFSSKKIFDNTTNNGQSGDDSTNINADNNENNNNNNQIDQLWSLFESTIVPHSNSNDINTDNDQLFDHIAQILPKIQANMYFSHLFYTKVQQEDFLISNVDLNGVINAGLYQNIIMGIKIGQYNNEIEQTVSDFFMKQALKAHKFEFSDLLESFTSSTLSNERLTNSEITMGPKFSSKFTKFNNFLKEIVVPVYISTLMDTININIIRPDYLTTLLTEREDDFLTPDQKLNAKIDSDDLNLNLNESFWLFQALNKIHKTTGIHNGQVLMKDNNNEQILNQFLLTLSHRKYLQQQGQEGQRDQSSNQSSSSLGLSMKYSLDPIDNTITLLLVDLFKDQLTKNDQNNQKNNTNNTNNNINTNQSNELVSQFTSTPMINIMDNACEECKAQEAKEFNIYRADFLTKMVNISEWLCHDLWPSIAQWFGKNMCDPTVPGECYELCSGMVVTYKDSVADLLSFMNHDPQRTCFKKGICTYNPDDTVPDFPPTNLVKEQGDINLLRQIFHITDVHWDHLYSTEKGSRIRCHLPVCCSKATNTTEISTIFGIPGALFELEKIKEMNYGDYNEQDDVPSHGTDPTDVNINELIQDFLISFEDKVKNDHNNNNDIDNKSIQTKKDNINNKSIQTKPIDNKFNYKSLRNEAPRKYGEYLCDAPAQLVESSVEQILLYCSDFGIFTGDAPAHDLWRQNQEANINAMEWVTEQISSRLQTCKKMWNLRQKYYDLIDYDLKLQQGESSNGNNYDNDLDSAGAVATGGQNGGKIDGQIDGQNDGKTSSHQYYPKRSILPLINMDNELEYRFGILWDALPQDEKDMLREQDKQRDPNFIPRFYPSIGNHLYSPVNHFAGFGGFDDWFLNPLSKLWSNFLPSQPTATTKFGGYYVTNAGPDLYIISLHTGLLDIHNPWRILNLGHWDPSGQGHFLTNILFQCRQLKSKVILIMHEPLGDIIKGSAYQYYFSIYKKYFNDVILNVLAGHEHHDYTKLIHTDYPINMTSVDYIKKELYQQHLSRPFDLNPLLQSLGQSGQGQYQPQRQTANGSGYLTRSSSNNDNHHHYRGGSLLNQIPMLKLLQSSRFGSRSGSGSGGSGGSGSRSQSSSLSTSTPYSSDPTPTNLRNLIPMVLELLPSSITPMNYESNPSFRILDLKFNGIIDYRQYLFNIQLQDIIEPTAYWKLKYKASEIYQIQSSTASSLSSLSSSTTLSSSSSSSTQPQQQQQQQFINAEWWHQIILQNQKNNEFFKELTLRFWGYIEDDLDPEFQEERWNILEALCATYTYSKIEMDYCIQHWNDKI